MAHIMNAVTIAQKLSAIKDLLPEKNTQITSYEQLVKNIDFMHVSPQCSWVRNNRRIIMKAVTSIQYQEYIDRQAHKQQGSHGITHIVTQTRKQQLA